MAICGQIDSINHFISYLKEDKKSKEKRGRKKKRSKGKKEERRNKRRENLGFNNIAAIIVLLFFFLLFFLWHAHRSRNTWNGGTGTEADTSTSFAQEWIFFTNCLLFGNTIVVVFVTTNWSQLNAFTV